MSDSDDAAYQQRDMLRGTRDGRTAFHGVRLIQTHEHLDWPDVPTDNNTKETE